MSTLFVQPPSILEYFVNYEFYFQGQFFLENKLEKKLTPILNPSFSINGLIISSVVGSCVLSRLMIWPFFKYFFMS